MMLMKIFLKNAVIMMIIAVQKSNNYDHDNTNNDSNNDAIIMIMMTLIIMITVIVFFIASYNSVRYIVLSEIASHDKIHDNRNHYDNNHFSLSSPSI